MNPWVFCYTYQMQIVLIAAHSWDNISWEFPGRWKVLVSRIDYTMHYSKIIEKTETELNSDQNTCIFQSCSKLTESIL